MSAKTRKLLYYTFQSLDRRRSRTVRAASLATAKRAIPADWVCVSVKRHGTVSAPPRKGWYLP